jgi:hypothetical protein
MVGKKDHTIFQLDFIFNTETYCFPTVIFWPE